MALIGSGRQVIATVWGGIALCGIFALTSGAVCAEINRPSVTAFIGGTPPLAAPQRSNGGTHPHLKAPSKVRAPEKDPHNSSFIGGTPPPAEGATRPPKKAPP